MIPEIFKYNSVISVPLFSLIAVWLIYHSEGFLWKRHTVSETILLVSHKKYQTIFRYIFLIKAVLDLGFFWFLFSHFHISLQSPIAWIFIAEAVLFGLLAYVTEGPQVVLHKIISHGSSMTWAICELYLASLTKNPIFLWFTYGVVLSTVFAALFFEYTKKDDHYC